MRRKMRMNIETMKINWTNFFRQAVGMPKVYPVKVKRSREAKKYPLIHASKPGDVGYNLPSVANMIIPAATEEQTAAYRMCKIRAGAHRHNGAQDLAEREEKDALTHLPKAMIPTGIHLGMPSTIWCSIEARSSSSSKMLITPDAIIDTGYVGELFIVIYNFGYMDYQVYAGDMLAQIIFHERIDIRPQETFRLKETSRGTTGFGSTGDNVNSKEGSKRT